MGVGKYVRVWPLVAGKEALGVVNYGLSVTTMESVFLRVAAGNTAHAAKTQAHRRVQSFCEERRRQTSSGNLLADENGGGGGGNGRAEDNDAVRVKLGGEAHKLTDPKKLAYAHFKALLRKRALYFKRDKKAPVGFLQSTSSD